MDTKGNFSPEERQSFPNLSILLILNQNIRYKYSNSAWFSFFSAPKLFAAKALQCARNGDIEGFRSTVSDWKSLCTMSMRENGRSLVDDQVTKSFNFDASGRLPGCRAELELTQDANRFDELDQVFKKQREDGKEECPEISRPNL